MADESFELEDGELVASVVNVPSSAGADDVQFRAQLHDAATVLRHGGQRDLARLALGLVEADLHDAIWVLNDELRGGGDFSGDPGLFDAFRNTIRGRLLSLHETGYNEHVISEAFPAMVLEAAQRAARRHVLTYYDIDEATQQQQPYRNGGFGAVPASAAAVRSLLEEQTFRAAAGRNDDDGIVECSICFEKFVDGDQVCVMPCPSRGHKFHPDCIAKWLAISNMCPLCRHELPAYYE